MADGIYAGTLPADIPAGHCTLSIRLGTFDTTDDPDDKPEQRIPTGATLTLTPNVTGPVILPDGTIMVIKGTVLTSDTGEFDFWAIDGMRSSVNPTGWNWTAVLKVDAATQKRFTFSPDSTSTTPLNLGPLIPISDPKTGVATVVGRGVASISVDPDTRHVLFVMSDDTTYDAGAIPPGPPGPANALSIGTVTQGATADAQITGESPEQTLNLTIPKGEAGPANTLTIGTVTQGTAAATITGASPNQTLNLVVPKGDPGPPNTLSIGTVATGATGTNAAASITGTAPNQTLNLTLPAGPKGDAGSGGGTNTHTGTGFPAAGLGAVGDTYLDTDATSGALVWRKWPTGWRVQEGDTGWRNITPVLVNGWTAGGFGAPLIRRVANTVFTTGSLTGSSASSDTWWTLPTGLRPQSFGMAPVFNTNSDTFTYLKVSYGGSGILECARAGIILGPSWGTSEAWPATLPGTPA